MFPINTLNHIFLNTKWRYPIGNLIDIELRLEEN